MKDNYDYLGVGEFDCSKWNFEQLKKLVYVDYWDTMEYLVKNTYLQQSIEDKKKISRTTFNENTRISIWSLNSLFLGAIKELEKRMENSYKQKLELANIFQLYIYNKNLKDRREFVKWKAI